MKEFFKELWEKIKTWAVSKLWPWFKKEWMIIVNFLVLGILYKALPTDSGLGVLVGFWIFVQLGVIGWRLFKKAGQHQQGNLIISDNENPVKPGPNVPWEPVTPSDDEKEPVEERADANQ